MNNIVLVGFMGTGKSSVGQELAQRLQWPFVDTDREIEEETGLSIPEIFRRYGEVFFRRKEQEVIQRVMKGRRQVIATGGGAVIDKENRELLRSQGVVICLKAAPELIWERVKEQGDRPLLQKWEELEELLAKREPFYQDVDLTVDTSHKSPAEVGETILALLGWRKDGGFSLQLLRVNLPQVGYNIFVQPGLISKAALYLPSGLGKRVLVISDKKVGPLYGDALLSSLQEEGFQPFMQMVEEGEKAKDLSVVADLYQTALETGIDRHCPIIALGGGVVGDLAGFVAATFMRGVPFIQIPTTLLAQVDSSIGGKVGVNLPQGKNLVGSFYQPRAVLSDPNLLQSLPPRELRAGLAEVVKYGLVFSPELYHLLEGEVNRYLALEPHLMAQIIAECCRLKASLVEKDEREEYGFRMLLNFGHTIGHALERAAGYGSLLHGEAVAVGMVAACRLAVALGLSHSDLVYRVESLLERIGLPTRIYGININVVFSNLIYDKKAREGNLLFILLKDIGQPVVRDDVPEGIITGVLADLVADKGR